MTLQIHCVYCGRRERELEIEKPSDLELATLAKRIKREGFIVEFTADNLDIYCCKGCAAGTTKL
jgi:hypothetical protein